MDWWRQVALLLEEIESFAVLPPSPLNADPAHGHPGDRDTAVGGPHHCGGNSTPDIVACPGVGFLKFGGEADFQAFQRGLRLGTQQAVQGDKKGEEVSALLKAIFQELTFFPLLCGEEDFIWRIDHI